MTEDEEPTNEAKGANAASSESSPDEPPGDEVQILDVSADDDELADPEQALADEAAALEIATRQPPVAPLLLELGVEVDDLAVAELAATGGPVYDLTEFDDVDEVVRLLDLLDTMSVRWALDRSGQLVIHYNDEAAVDEMIERVFEDPYADAADFHNETDDDGDGQSVQPTETDGEPAAAAFDFADGNITIDVSEPSVPSTGNGASRNYGVSDAEGRPAFDDLTANPSPIVTGGTPLWVAAIGLAALFAVLVVLFIVFVV